MPLKEFHESVLKSEVIEALSIKADGIYIDATFGRGGHSKSILNSLGTNGRLVALDKDPEAIASAVQLKECDTRLLVVHTNFGRISMIPETAHLLNSIDGILFDLGVSSPQLDDPSRGFSFLRDGPLDMRMNPEEGISAKEWLNSAAETEIANTLYKYGEERFSRRIARRIVTARASRCISTTSQLSEIVKEAIPVGKKGKHPATQTFQAIRILINQELEELRIALDEALKLLKLGGRLVVISFHSLEDRIVKQFIAGHTTGDKFPRHLPITSNKLNPRLKKIKSPQKANIAEVDHNPRARSAIMRVAEKLN